MCLGEVIGLEIDCFEDIGFVEGLRILLRKEKEDVFGVKIR